MRLRFMVHDFRYIAIFSFFTAIISLQIGCQDTNENDIISRKSPTVSKDDSNKNKKEDDSNKNKKEDDSSEPLKKEVINDTSKTRKDTDTAAIPSENTKKRGVSLNSREHGKILSETGKVHWFYNWGAVQEPIGSMEFIPMIWGHRDFSLSPSQSEYLLGFNEPNFCEQANMTPEEAAKYWREIIMPKANGRKTVSPAVNNSAGLARCGKPSQNTTDGVNYLKAFFAACTDCKVDFIAIHSYTCQASITINQIKKYISAFPNKKIWLTEFAAAYCPPYTHLFESATEQDQIAYMKGLLPYLDSEPQIYRYSWFKAHGSPTPWLRGLSLVGPDLKLTALGQIYTSP